MALRAMAMKAMVPAYCSPFPLSSSVARPRMPCRVPVPRAGPFFLEKRFFSDRFSLEAGETGNVSVRSQSAEVAAPTEAEAEDVHFVDALDIRVGRVIKAWKHPEADSLYVEEVDLAEEEGPRTICSGLVKYIPEEELQGRPVLVLANLKPRNMRGVKSNGMLLAASDAAHENVELLTPPEGSVPGDRVWFGDENYGTTLEPVATPNQLQKKKIWESCQPKLKVDSSGVATYEGRTMRTTSGVVTAQTLRDANIS